MAEQSSLDAALARIMGTTLTPEAPVAPASITPRADVVTLGGTPSLEEPAPAYVAPVTPAPAPAPASVTPTTFLPAASYAIAPKETGVNELNLIAMRDPTAKNWEAAIAAQLAIGGNSNPEFARIAGERTANAYAGIAQPSHVSVPGTTVTR
jgi:hypothetical protein